MTCPEKLRGIFVAIDVGHGSCSFVSSSCGEKCVLIDTGPKSALLEFLVDEGISNIDCVYISHTDSDHIAGLIGLLASQTVRIGRVILNSDGVKDTHAWANLRQELDQASRRDGLVFDVGLTSQVRDTYNDLNVAVVAPSPYLASAGNGGTDRHGRRLSANSVSAAFKVSIDGGAESVLVAGDIDHIALDDALDRGTEMACSVLVYPHHGGLPGKSDVEEFVNALMGATQANCVLFSNGRGRHDNPREVVVAAVINARPDVSIACTQLSLACSENLAESVDHLFECYSSGKSRRFSCGGSLVIPLASAPPDRSSVAAHYAFVAACVPGALCRKRRAEPSSSVH